MKLIKSTILAFAVLTSSATFAQGVEEYCQETTQLDLRSKNIFAEDPAFLKEALALADKPGVSPKTRAKFRERLYFVYNRRHMSDKDLEQLVFINCLLMHK